MTTSDVNYPFRLIPILLLFAAAGCAPVEPAQTQLESQQATPGAEAGSGLAEVHEDQGTSAPVAEIRGGDEQGLREFMERWFTNYYPGAPQEQTIVTIGALPESLPADIPLPDGTRVIGSLQDPWSDQIILDVPLAPDQVESFYAEALAEAGWRRAPEHPQGSGFVAGEMGWEAYCSNEGAVYLSVSAQSTGGGLTDVRLNFQETQDPYLCSENMDQYSMDPGMQMMPELIAPSGVGMMSNSSGGGSDGSAYSTTELETALTPQELLDHYNLQIEGKGWQKIDQGSNEASAWSGWRLNDDRGDAWGGMLVILDSPLGSEKRFALFNLEPMK